MNSLETIRISDFYEDESGDKYICENCFECRSASRDNIYEINGGEYLCRACYENFIGGD